MKWNENLPNVDEWKPRSDRQQTVSTALLISCQAAQERILREADIERRFNIDNFDSGPGLEDMVRQEISRLLPSRYTVEAGVVNDKDGNTAGDFEVVIANRIWAPAVKLGATSQSRRFHFPIEAIYALLEVKQTLGYQELDAAMEKLVKAAKLDRPDHPYGHITENQHLESLDQPGRILNPLHTAILGTRIREDVSFRDLCFRFFAINRRLKWNDMVKFLCVLQGGGAAFYATKGQDGKFTGATFMIDLGQQLCPGIYDQEPDNALYWFYVELLGHLTRSVLEVHDLHRRYGLREIQAEQFTWDR